MSSAPENETRCFDRDASAPGRRPGTTVLRVAPHLIRSATAIGRTIGGWIARRAQRQALAKLDSHLLTDIGKTRAEAVAEARKPFWRN